MRVIEPDPKQLALALQFLPELVIRHLHEVLVAPLAQGAFLPTEVKKQAFRTVPIPGFTGD
ncbi:hypothetical protein [Methanoculleus sp.]|uniref:hypothetical protein n=1 Tax=Methanoculleus sp. TaxID=90427 RepID=UPI00261663E8|nr:hypothetical protein [Methanoculleus sp.]MDD2253023.1 hypothetical protein [Methanoculleus sp.]MDD2786619.1 hypothetical protein [Methanoculleus sp.]MDD3216246.1 hypothetical protein [Methanoculleus sp.]HOI58015.1 hypothetical protein [Methanoculleus sp.]